MSALGYTMEKEPLVTIGGWMSPKAGLDLVIKQNSCSSMKLNMSHPKVNKRFQKHLQRRE
jgi:hypothetical protein